MIDPAQQLQQTLREHGFSLTAPRTVVFNAMQVEQPKTMRELVAECETKTDRASVYRTVSLFEKLGVIHRVQMGWKYKLELSDAFQHHHHHLICTVCNKLCVLHEDLLLERHIHATASAHGYILQDHQLELKGVCFDCQKKEPIQT